MSSHNDRCDFTLAALAAMVNLCRFVGLLVEFRVERAAFLMLFAALRGDLESRIKPPSAQGKASSGRSGNLYAIRGEKCLALASLFVSRA